MRIPRIEIWRASDGKPIASVMSWEAAAAVERLMGGVKIAENLIWTGLVIMPVPTRNLLLADLSSADEPARPSPGPGT